VPRANHDREHQADDQRNCGHDFEIDERLDSYAAHLLEISRPGDAMHDYAKHDRCHDHGDQLEKRVTEDLEAGCEPGRHYAEHHSQYEGDHDL